MHLVVIQIAVHTSGSSKEWIIRYLKRPYRPQMVKQEEEFMLISDMSERDEAMEKRIASRIILEKFERSKILEIYFSRLDGRLPESISSDHHELYEIELGEIKNFLLGQHPHDSILQKIFRIMS